MNHNAARPTATTKVVYEVTVPVCLMIEIEVQENERATQLMALAIGVARVRHAVQSWKTCPMLAMGSRATIGKPRGTQMEYPMPATAARHTPGDLKIIDTNKAGELFLGIGDDPNAICIVTINLPFPTPGHTLDEIKANAERLALCWNCHDEWLAMLEDALPCVEESEQFNKPSCRELSRRIRAAITRATTPG